MFARLRLQLEALGIDKLLSHALEIPDLVVDHLEPVVPDLLGDALDDEDVAGAGPDGRVLPLELEAEDRVALVDLSHHQFVDLFVRRY